MNNEERNPIKEPKIILTPPEEMSFVPTNLGGADNGNDDEDKKKRKYTPLLWILLIGALLVIGFLLRNIFTATDRIDFQQRMDESLQRLSDEELAELYEFYKGCDGDWSGFWQNLDTGNAGTAYGNCRVTPDGLISVSVDIDGAVFGAVDPDPAIYVGYYDTQGAHFYTEDDPVFGDVILDAYREGNTLEASAINIPYIRRSVSGRASWEGGQLDINYIVDFFGGRQTHGVVQMTKAQ